MFERDFNILNLSAIHNIIYNKYYFIEIVIYS